MSTACLVLHVLGAVGLFAALGVEGAGLFCLSRATTHQEVRAALGALGLNRFVGPPSILATLAPGLYMTRNWGWRGQRVIWYWPLTVRYGSSEPFLSPSHASWLRHVSTQASFSSLQTAASSER